MVTWNSAPAASDVGLFSAQRLLGTRHQLRVTWGCFPPNGYLELGTSSACQSHRWAAATKGQLRLLRAVPLSRVGDRDKDERPRRECVEATAKALAGRGVAPPAAEG